ncbi:MAG: ankyrin repeat domain-containing protein [Kiritimatiellae bacterium]|nr:ankyrin repeat domain-containing protein [Kiritimatiellia bacterium]
MTDRSGNVIRVSEDDAAVMESNVVQVEKLVSDNLSVPSRSELARIGGGALTSEQIDKLVRIAQGILAEVKKQRVEFASAKVDRAISEILTKKAAEKKWFKSYAIPSAAELARIAGVELSKDELAEVAAAAEKSVRAYEKSIVWPKWVEDRIATVEDAAGKALAAGDYAKVREIIWRASATGVPEVDEKIREYGYEYMNTKVNPADWARIEKDILSRCEAFDADGKYEEAIEFLLSYPRIRTFSKQLDRKIDDVKNELLSLGVKEEGIDPAVSANLKLVAAAARIFDMRDSTTNLVTTVESDPVKPDLTEFEKRLKEYRDTLVLFNCTEANADDVTEKFRADLAAQLAALGKAATVKSTSESFLFLGTTAVNERTRVLIEKLLAEFRAKIQKRDDDARKAAIAECEDRLQKIIDDLVARVTKLVNEGKYTEAREVIRDVALVEETEELRNLDIVAEVWNARIYATRIGLLNSVVNPNQYESLCKEIDAKIAAFMESEDYEGLNAYVEGYPYVHDTYGQILAALEEIKSAMAGLGIAETPATGYITSVTARIAEIMEKRTGTYSPGKQDPDLAELEKALAELQNGFIAQYYNSDAAKAFCDRVRAEILAMLAKNELESMTTWEMNELLRARLVKPLQGLAELAAARDARRAREAYAALLEAIDAEVSFDSQIAIAEDAISKQLGIVCPVAYLDMNAVLGDYARIVRLMKRGAEVSADDATTLLVGAAYLNQPAMFDRAIELGAVVDKPAKRDPRKRPALLVAIETGHNAFISKINAADGSQTVVDASGNTALHYAMRRGNLRVAKALLSQVDVKAVNTQGETALFTAVRRNQAAPVKFLAESIADESERNAYVLMKNAAGDDAFEAACKANAHAVLSVLESAGADYGEDDLVEAAKNDRLAIAQWLVERGLDVNAEGVMAAAAEGPDGRTEEERKSPTETFRYLCSEGGVAPKPAL